MKRFARRVGNGISWRVRGVILRIPGATWLAGWANPLHIAQQSLRQAISERAGYAHGLVLDVGCGGQPYRKMFSQIEFYVGMDLPSNGCVNVYGDGQSLPFFGAVFDTVLCNEVLEHVPEPSQFMAEVGRVLKPGGVLLLTTPQTWGLHHEPHDFYRYTKYGLRYLAEKNGFIVIEVFPTCGMWATVAQRMADTVIYNYAVGRSQPFVRVLSLILAPVLMAGYGLDKLFGKRGDTLDHVMVAKKISQVRPPGTD